MKKIQGEHKKFFLLFNVSLIEILVWPVIVLGAVWHPRRAATLVSSTLWPIEVVWTSRVRTSIALFPTSPRATLVMWTSWTTTAGVFFPLPLWAIVVARTPRAWSAPTFFPSILRPTWVWRAVWVGMALVFRFLVMTLGSLVRCWTAERRWAERVLRVKKKKKRKTW